jgi:hypothetical protein
MDEKATPFSPTALGPPSRSFNARDPASTAGRASGNGSSSAALAFGTSLLGGWADDVELDAAAGPAPKASPRGHGPTVQAPVVGHRHGLTGPQSTSGAGDGVGGPSPHRPRVSIQLADGSRWAEEAEELGAEGGAAARGGSSPGPIPGPRRSGYVALALTSNALAGLWWVGWAVLGVHSWADGVGPPPYRWLFLNPNATPAGNTHPSCRA